MPILCLLLLLVGIANAITIDEAIEIAVRKNPKIKAFEKIIESYEGKKVSAKAFPNPDLSIESVSFNRKDYNPQPFYLIELSQDIPLWGIREKSYSMVSSEEEAFLNELEKLKREVEAKVYRGFYEALYRKENLRILKENLKIVEELERYISEAYSYGEATDLELLRIKREKDIIVTRLKIAESLYISSLKELSSIIGSEVDTVEGNIRSIISIGEINIENLPSILAIRRRIEAIDKSIELEKALAKPSFSLGLVAEDSEKGYYEYRLLIGSTLPIFYRRQGEILEKVALKESLFKEVEGEILRVRMLLESIQARYKTLISRLNYIEENTLPNAKEELEIALSSYKEGVITLFELSNIREAYYSIEKERIEILRELHKTIADYISLGGWKR